MKKAPNITTLRNVLDTVETCSVCINGLYIPARPLGFYSLRYRIKAAWIVFTGKADALVWPGGQ